MRLDIEPGTEYLLPFAKKKLEQLKRDTPALINKRIYASSGEEIFVQRGVVDLIRIRGAAQEGALRVPAVPDFNAADGGVTSLAWTEFQPGASLLAKGDKVVSSGLGLAAFQRGLLSRALRAKQFYLAEGILRFIGNTAGDTDIALYCDEGFFVDVDRMTLFFQVVAQAAKSLEIFGGVDYSWLTAEHLDKLKRIVAPYAATFTHDALPAQTTSIDFSDIDVAQYLPAGIITNSLSTFAAAAPDPNNGSALVTVPDAHLNVGVAVVRPWQLLGGFSAWQSGTAMSVNQTEFPGVAVSLARDNHATDEFVAHTFVLQHQTYIVSGTNFPSGGWLAENRTIPGAPSLLGGLFAPYGPMTISALTTKSRRVKRRRTPTGWIVESDVTVVAPPDQTIMQFTMRGSFLAPAYLLSDGGRMVAPPSSEYAYATFEDAAGSVTAFTRSLYRGTDVSYTQHPFSGGTEGVAHPVGDYALHEVYPPEPTPEFLPAADSIVRQRFKSASAEFTLDGRGVARVIDSSTGAVLHTVPPTTARTPDYPSRVMVSTCTFPDVATFAQYQTDARVNVGLQIYGLRGKERTAIAPFAPAGYACIYRLRTGAVMMFTAATSAANVAAAQLAYANAIVGGDKADIEQKRTALLATVSIVVNTGMPEDFVVFGSLDDTRTTVLI